jgi:hypothetical protein
LSYFILPGGLQDVSARAKGAANHYLPCLLLTHSLFFPSFLILFSGGLQDVFTRAKGAAKPQRQRCGARVPRL